MTVGDKVRINFGTHKGNVGTISDIQERGNRLAFSNRLVFVEVPGVSRIMIYYPNDLELINT